MIRAFSWLYQAVIYRKNEFSSTVEPSVSAGFVSSIMQ